MAEAESAPVDGSRERERRRTETVEMSEQAAEGGDEEASGPEFGAGPTPGMRHASAFPPTSTPTQPILDEIELAVYGSYLLDQAELGVLGPTPETVCTGNFDILDRAIYVSDGRRATGVHRRRRAHGRRAGPGYRNLRRTGHRFAVLTPPTRRSFEAFPACAATVTVCREIR